MADENSRERKRANESFDAAFFSAFDAARDYATHFCDADPDINLETSFDERIAFITINNCVETSIRTPTFKSSREYQ
jgi:hypothetical protein